MIEQACTRASEWPSLRKQCGLRARLLASNMLLWFGASANTRAFAGRVNYIDHIHP